jgi:hypothetical protein
VSGQLQTRVSIQTITISSHHKTKCQKTNDKEKLSESRIRHRDGRTGIKHPEIVKDAITDAAAKHVNLGANGDSGMPGTRRRSDRSGPDTFPDKFLYQGGKGKSKT